MQLGRAALAALALVALAACGGGGDGSSAAPPDGGQPAPGQGPMHIIGGTVNGLAGSGLVLQLNGAGDLPLQINGAFAFGTALASGSSYTVTVLARPASPAQTCTVAGGTGSANGDVANVQVSCTTDPLGLLATVPADRGGGVERNVEPALIFSAPIDPATVSGSSVVMTEGSGAAVPASLTTDSATIDIAPASLLWPDTEYRIGADGVRGLHGEVLAGPARASFVTRDGLWQPDTVLPMRPMFADDESQRVAAARDGTATVAWRAADRANEWRIWATRRGPDGRWEAPVDVSTPVPGSTGHPALVVAPDGTAYVAWSSEMGIGGRQQVFVVRRGAAEAAWSAPLQLSVDTMNTNVEPSLGVGADGAVYAAWVGSNSFPYDIQLVRRLDDGTWSAPVVANEANGRSVFSPAVAVQGDGQALLVWIEQNGSDSTLKWRPYRRDVAAPEPLQAAADVAAGMPSGQVVRFNLALNAAGNGALVWEMNDGVVSKSWASLKGVIVGEWGPLQPLDSGTPAAREPQCAVDDEGNVITAWVGSGAGVLGGVYGKRYEQGAAFRSLGWGPVLEINGAAGGDSAALAMDARGNGLVLWRASNSEVRGARFTRRQGWKPAETVGVIGAAGSLFAPRITFDGSGSAQAIWMESNFAVRSGSSGLAFGIGGARFE